MFMENNKNIWLMPTNEPSRLYEGVNKELKFTNHVVTGKRIRCHNLCITSNEKIKENDLNKEIYVLDIQNGNIGKLTCKNRFYQGSSKLIEVQWRNKQNIWNYCYIREIILTTDHKLIADGIQAIPDDFLEWFVNNSSCEFVKIEKSPYDGTKSIDKYWGGEYKIIIPKAIKLTSIENKTPIQEAIDKIKEISNNENATGFSKRAYAVCLDVLEPLLEKEKQMFIDFFIEGDINCGRQLAQDYYNQKFKP